MHASRQLHWGSDYTLHGVQHLRRRFVDAWGGSACVAGGGRTLNQRRMLGNRSTRRMKAAGSVEWFSQAHRFFTCTSCTTCRAQDAGSGFGLDPHTAATGGPVRDPVMHTQSLSGRVRV